MSNATAPSPIAGLNKVQKLAALLVVLGPDEASVILSAFNQRQMEQIMTEMAKIEFLSADVQHSLLEEFSAVTLEAVTSALGGVGKAENVLKKSYGDVKAREVLGRVAPEANASPVLEELRNMPASAIPPILRGEGPQTWALVLAQLDAEASAEVFRSADPAFRADVMQRMARLEPVSPDVLDRLINGLLARRPATGAREHVGSDGTKFVTEIMKRLDKQSASDALEALAQADPELSASIRKLMFIFDDLVMVDPATMAVILREVDFNTLAVAMKGCPAKLEDMIIKSMTKRASEGLKEALKLNSKVKKRDVEEARARVMDQIFELEKLGEISLATEDANGGS